MGSRARWPQGVAPESFRPSSRAACVEYLREHFDGLAASSERWPRAGAAYHRELAHRYRALVPAGARVLEIGCGGGDLLAALRPAHGLGLDLSPGMVDLARRRHPQPTLEFSAVAVEDYSPGPGEVYDYIVLSDLLSFLYDIAAVLEQLRPLCHPRTRLVMSFHSRLWQPALSTLEDLGLKLPQPVLNWVTLEDVRNLCRLTGFEVVRSFPAILVPANLGRVSRLANRFLAPFGPLRRLCLTTFVVARLPQAPFATEPRVSVIVPCRNEEGNIPAIVARVPRMGRETEIVFVEGGSRDASYEACVAQQAAHPERPIQVLRQAGQGKNDAVRLGCAQASGDVLMILDADLTVPPERLPDFYAALVSGRIEFVNGSRLVYSMEPQAMRHLNLLANRAFSLIFSFLLEQRIKDTLCGTKVVTREDYRRIDAARARWGGADPFGDFDLLFGAAHCSLKIADLPIRYRERTYGVTNISRFSHGLMLLRMCRVGLTRLKCR